MQPIFENKIMSATVASLLLLTLPAANLGRFAAQQIENGVLDNLLSHSVIDDVPDAKPIFVSGTPLDRPMTDEELYQLMLKDQQEADRQYAASTAATAALASKPADSPAPVQAPPPQLVQTPVAQPNPANVDGDISDRIAKKLHGRHSED